MTKKKGDDKLDFEEGVKRLEELVGRLESGELGLADSLDAYTKGMDLAHALGRKLDEAEKRLELIGKDAAGALETSAFTLEDGED